MAGRRFSKLKARMESLFDSSLDLQIRCNVYQKYSPRQCSRFWVTLNKEIIFDFMKDFKYIHDFKHIREFHTENNKGDIVTGWNVSHINNLVQEYIETPVDKLLDYDFKDDVYGVTEILKAADRRIGKSKIKIL